MDESCGGRDKDDVLWFQEEITAKNHKILWFLGEKREKMELLQNR